MSEKNIDFEKSFKELETITASLEDEGVNIETGLKQFERGLALAKKLKTRLSEIENTIETIKVKFGQEGGDHASSEDRHEL